MVMCGILNLDLNLCIINLKKIYPWHSGCIVGIGEYEIIKGPQPKIGSPVQLTEDFYKQKRGSGTSTPSRMRKGSFAKIRK